MSDASRLIEKIPSVVTDKSVPIVVYCGVGGCAAVGKKALEALGFEKVLNGGGLKDLGYVQKL